MSKNYAQKLVLENFIFWRATCLGTPVYDNFGRLQSPSWEPFLHVSIYLYNTCFADEHNVFYPTHNPWPYGGVKNGWILPQLTEFDKILKIML